MGCGKGDAERGRGMPSGYLVGLDQSEVIRAPEYSARLLDALATSKRTYRSIIRMESALVAADGYPENSFSASEKLRLISSKEWEELIAVFDEITPGGSLLALNYVEYQRIMQTGDIVIFYAILNLRRRRRIVLLDLHFSAAPTWGEMMKWIYRITVVRR
jgi:hypothetical protein